MFSLENILTYANSNIQIIGIFIAIIGGLVATKLLNTKIEKDSLKDKLSKINKEISFNKLKKTEKENIIFLRNKEDYILYIYDKILEKDFDINNYEDYNLSIEERFNIIKEIKEIMRKALEIFEEEHNKSQIEDILKKNHIKNSCIEYTIYEYIGKQTSIKSNKFFDVSDIIYDTGPIIASSFQDNLEERDLNNNINDLEELLEWKIIEKKDIESKIEGINQNLNIKYDVWLFILITIFSIIVPQIVLSIYPLFINLKWLKYPFAIYSIVSFVISMISMLLYIFKLFFNICKDSNN